MIPPEVIIVPAIFGIPAAVLYARMVLKHKEKMASLGSGPSSTVTDARLARIEEAVEAIAIEMERMGEGQRFVTKLLSERAPALPAAAPARAERPLTSE